MWRELTEEIRQQQAFLDMLAMGWTADYAASGGRIFCGRGCRECCNLVVNTTFAEAVAIAATLSEEQAKAVHVHVAKLRERIGGVVDMRGYLRMHRQDIGLCPLLDAEGACGVYAVRPLSCRALLSTMESRWCGADFVALPPDEKQAFVERLDRSVVAFPMHYVASTQEAAQEMEALAGRRMAARFGFSLYGSLPVLVHLALDHGLAEACAEGYDTATRILARAGLDHHFLAYVER